MSCLRFTCAISAHLCIFLFFGLPLNAQEVVPGEYLLKLNAPAVAQFRAQGANQGVDSVSNEMIEGMGFVVIERSEGGVHLVRSADPQAEQFAVSAMAQNDAVELFEPNYIYHASKVPNDLSASLWGLNNTGQNGGTADVDIDAPRAWDVTEGSEAIAVAVVDSGVDYNHPDLRSNRWTNVDEIPNNGIDDDGNGYIDDIFGWDAQNNRGDPMDADSHGTHVAGTIGARGNNGTGVVGVNWRVQIVGIRFLGAGGSGNSFDAIEGIDYAVRLKQRHDANLPGGADIRVINASWGGAGFSSSLQAAVQRANAAGILFVAAAGNGGADGRGDNNDVSPQYPASFNVANVISVAAVTRTGQLASFSNFGLNTVDLAAPGVSIRSTVPGGYGSLSGTSMAAPHVAGAAALVSAGNSSLSAAAVKAALLSSTKPLASLNGRVATGGLLNAADAVGAGNPNPTPTPTPTPTPPPTAAPAAPTGLAFRTNIRPRFGVSGQIEVTFVAPTQRADGSALPADQIDGHNVEVIGLVSQRVSATTVTVNGVTLNTDYRFRVTTVDLQGRESEPSPILTIRFNDGDGDGIDDAADECPMDPNKTEPGACGCGKIDDANNDGVLDCTPQPSPSPVGSPQPTPSQTPTPSATPNPKPSETPNPSPTAPGDRGVANAELDFDGDGVSDALLAESTGEKVLFTIVSGNDARQTEIEYGRALDVPVPGHYTPGDMADIALARVNDSNMLEWDIRSSETGASEQFDLISAPAVAIGGCDFDGDGLDDPTALNRKELVTLLSGSGGTRLVQEISFGTLFSKARHACFDRDGDGREELALLGVPRKARRWKRVLRQLKKNPAESGLLRSDEDSDSDRVSRLKRSFAKVARNTAKRGKRAKPTLMIYSIEGAVLQLLGAPGGKELVWLDLDGDNAFEPGYYKSRRKTGSQLVLFGEEKRTIDLPAAARGFATGVTKVGEVSVSSLHLYASGGLFRFDARSLALEPWGPKFDPETVLIPSSSAGAPRRR